MPEKTRVLIVDDDVGFAESLSDILDEKGYEVTVVNSGEEALEKVGQTLFGVILMDIRMPVMDGVETYKRVKEIAPQTTVIMMTAFAVGDIIKDVLKEGVYGVVYKPLDIDRVVNMIEISKKDGVLIMVVDDSPNIRESLKNILEHKGYVVNLAKDGEEAIEIARRKPEDIVFIDMKLPALNGLETYLALKKINSEMKAVMMTAYRQETKDLVQEALKNNAYTCIYKPFPPQKAVEIVEEIIRKKGNKG